MFINIILEKNMSYTKVLHYRFWRDQLLVALTLTIVVSIERYYFHYPQDTDWSWAIWLLHLSTIAIAIKVAFFSISTRDLQRLYLTDYYLEQLLDCLGKEEPLVQRRVAKSLVELVCLDPPAYDCLLRRKQNLWFKEFVDQRLATRNEHEVVG